MPAIDAVPTQVQEQQEAVPIPASPATSTGLRGSLNRLFALSKTGLDKVAASNSYLKYGLDKITTLSQPVVSTVVQYGDPLVDQVDARLSTAYQAIHETVQTRVVAPVKQLHLADLTNQLASHAKIKDATRFITDASKAVNADWGKVLQYSQATFDRILPEAAEPAAAPVQVEGEAPASPAVGEQSPVTLVSLSQHVGRRLQSRVKGLSSAAMSFAQKGRENIIKAAASLPLPVDASSVGDIVTYADQVLAKIQASVSTMAKQPQLEAAIQSVKARLDKVKTLVGELSGTGKDTILTTVQPLTTRLRAKAQNVLQRASDLTAKGRDFLTHRPLSSLPSATVSLLSTAARKVAGTASASSAPASPASSAPASPSSPSLSPASASPAEDARAQLETESAQLIEGLVALMKEVFTNWDAPASPAAAEEAVPVPAAVEAVAASSAAVLTAPIIEVAAAAPLAVEALPAPAVATA